MDANTLKEAAAVHADIIRLGLERHPLFDRLTVEEFAGIYNGIGPDKWPEPVRDVFTLIYRHFKPLPGVHDIDFHFSDGTRYAWEDATARWKRNGARMLDDRYPLRNPLNWKPRLIAWLKIRAAWRALELASFDIYKEAHAARVAREKTI